MWRAVIRIRSCNRWSTSPPAQLACSRCDTQSKAIGRCASLGRRGQRARSPFGLVERQAGTSGWHVGLARRACDRRSPRNRLSRLQSHSSAATAVRNSRDALAQTVASTVHEFRVAFFSRATNLSPFAELGRSASAHPTQEERMKLGAFSVSLSVKNIEASKVFYEQLGFTKFSSSGFRVGRGQECRGSRSHQPQ